MTGQAGGHWRHIPNCLWQGTWCEVGRQGLQHRVGQVLSGREGRARVVRVLGVGRGCVGKVGGLAILVRELKAACP